MHQLFFKSMEVVLNEHRAWQSLNMVLAMVYDQTTTIEKAYPIHHEEMCWTALFDEPLELSQSIQL